MNCLTQAICDAALCVLMTGTALSQALPEGAVEMPAGLAFGRAAVLPNGWTITPAGKQIPLSTLPMSMAASPDGRFLLVLNGGFLPPSISVIDLQSQAETARVPIDDGWLGLTFHPKGDKVYVGGGSAVSVFEFEFREGKLTPARAFPVVPWEKRLDSDHVGDVLVSPDGRFLYAANVFRNSVTVMNVDSGFVVSQIKTGRRPYRLLWGPDRKTLLVSHWAEASVGAYRLSDGKRFETVRVGPHPTDMVILPGAIETPEGEPPIVARLFVACANLNSVSAVSMTEGNRFRPLEQIPVSPTAAAPVGSMPTALALSADGKLLYVAASGNNAIVIADVSGGRAELVGAIPTGWFPTAVLALKDGGFAYLSGKGSGSRPNPRGPDPTRRGEARDYVAALETGSLGILPRLDQQQRAALTVQFIENTPYEDGLLDDAGVPAGNPIPNRPGDPSPIEHVIYVIKENRSYDQVLGDLERGNGDPKLVVFDERTTPNHHKLAREFVLLDNFHTTGSVSADGQNWSAGALANDYVEKLWPSYYGRRRRIYDFEGGEPTAVPAAGYLWTNAIGCGLTVRNYGVWTGPPRTGSTMAGVGDPGLLPHTNRAFAPFDLDVREEERVDEFLREFQELSAAGRLPRLMLVRLPGDHTAGREPGKRTPQAMVAEHDFALGRLVEAVSRSEAWDRTAIFIVEDDAQDGADHVDAHRAPAVAHDRVDSGTASDDAVRRFRDADVSCVHGGCGPGSLPGGEAGGGSR
jgi:YVTN family beta-propeller protein